MRIAKSNTNNNEKAAKSTRIKQWQLNAQSSQFTSDLRKSREIFLKTSEKKTARSHIHILRRCNKICLIFIRPTIFVVAVVIFPMWFFVFHLIVGSLLDVRNLILDYCSFPLSITFKLSACAVLTWTGFTRCKMLYRSFFFVRSFLCLCV